MQPSSQSFVLGPVELPSVERKPRKGDRIVVTIDRLDTKGQGIGSVEWPVYGQFPVLVRHAPPGSTLLVEVVRRRSEKVEARRIEWLDMGPEFVEPMCKHYGTCGGCAFQNLRYERQLIELQRLVAEVLNARKVLGDVEVEPVIGMPDPRWYRNKMDFTFGNRRWIEEGEEEGVSQDFGLGMHVPFRHDKVMDVKECFIAFPEAQNIVNSARSLALKMGLAPWNLREHDGLLRYLVLRKGFHSGEILAYLVTSAEAADQVNPYAAALVEAHPEITTLVQGINSLPAGVAVGHIDRLLHGPGVIHESMGGVTFELSPKSFFQTNTLQAERLVEVVREEVGSDGHKVVYDLYCGTGLLGLAVTPADGELIGFEREASSVVDARANAKRLGMEHATFVEGDVLERLAEGIEGRAKPDVVIVDPPRVGLHPKVLPGIAALAAPKLVYVSCSVKNAARDLVELQARGYRLDRVRPLDLFPHTPHVEVVLTLTLVTPESE
ncbi:MAG: 23S rRNA (uracil(1939)-C(5))-methyltransferase RlmD [Planctomycetes bacterium]|nr:23S rRNA (uracil(1939)-C(5))-methyltransferase RlmD [Planctomycetota bacterium]